MKRGTVPGILVEKLHVQSAAILLQGVSKFVLSPEERQQAGKGERLGISFLPFAEQSKLLLHKSCSAVPELTDICCAFNH